MLSEAHETDWYGLRPGWGGAMRLVVRGGTGGLWWTLVPSSGDDRPVARAVVACRDVDGCRAAVASLSGPRLRKSAVRDGDRWRWQVSDASGRAVAESADTFDSVAACGYDLYELRHRLARTVVDRRHVDLAAPADRRG